MRYGNGTQVARVRAVTRTGYLIDRMVGGSTQVYSADNTPTHVIYGFEWRETKAPLKATDRRILGPVPLDDPRRHSPAFNADDYGFYRNP